MTQELTLHHFFSIMQKTQIFRKEIVRKIINNETIKKTDINHLESVLSSILNINKTDYGYQLFTEKDRSISVDLSYEINELKKDIFFLQNLNSQQDFLIYLNKLNKNFIIEIQNLTNDIAHFKIDNFITDRDGTINNYCGRYASSIQSIYNAVFLSRFAKKRVKNAVILTSAPLENIGIIDLSIAPDDIFIYAGSKGREYYDKKGHKHCYPIKQDKQEKLDLLNERLSALVKHHKYEVFSLIGSGLQFKFGQTTIARQDINGSIDEKESLEFLSTIKEIVKEIDPSGNYFVIEDTSKDIEIILTLDSKNTGSKDFDKGDGLKFLNDKDKLELSIGTSLICGDTDADIPLIETSQAISKDTLAIFVTEDEDLKLRVNSICKQSYFVSTPDALVTALYKLSKH